MNNKYSKLQEFCKTLEKQWKYIAKDSDGEVWCFIQRPYKNGTFEGWDGPHVGSMRIPDGIKKNIFDCLSWEDEQPYNIAKGELADET